VNKKRGFIMKHGKRLVIERIFNAPRSAVWRAWTGPDLRKWWGPEGFSAPLASVDLRPGGRYVFAMHGPEGSDWDKDMYSAGVYKEIVPQTKLVVTDYFSDEKGEMLEPANAGPDPDFPRVSTVTELFEEAAGGKTKLTIMYPEPETKKEREAMVNSGMKEGWNSSLDKLKKTLEMK